MKRRIYTDTSVIGGCLDEEFEESSQQLFERFHQGEDVVVISELTLLELECAPEEVRSVLENVPAVHREDVEFTEEASRLAISTFTLESLLKQADWMLSTSRLLPYIEPTCW